MTSKENKTHHTHTNSWASKEEPTTNLARVRRAISFEERGTHRQVKKVRPVGPKTGGRAKKGLSRKGRRDCPFRNYAKELARKLAFTTPERLALLR